MDEQTKETNSDDEDDAEDDNDTGLSGGPVLALDQLAHGASGNELLVDGGHCVLSGEFGYVSWVEGVRKREDEGKKSFFLVLVLLVMGLASGSKDWGL